MGMVNIGGGAGGQGKEFEEGKRFFFEKRSKKFLEWSRGGGLAWIKLRRP